MPDEVARIGALSNGSNGQRSLESASLHFEPIWRRERGNAERESPAEILSERSESKDPPDFTRICGRDPELPKDLLSYALLWRPLSLQPKSRRREE